VKAAGIGRLRFHDLRHRAITDLAEAVLSEQTIMSIAGHLSTKMLEHYSHIRRDARRAAVDGLYRKNLRTGRDTAQSTAQLHQNGAMQLLQVFERNGGDDGTRTRGLCRDSAQG